MSTREWNADLYHQISAPQVSWGKKVLGRVRLRGDEHVMDAGCGTGRLTRDLLEGLPNGRVTAVDVSQNMLRSAEQHLVPQFGERVQFVHSDLQHLQFNQQFDGIFSTASFHWIKDHNQLFARLFRALKPGGWLIAQCGGSGNLACFISRVDRLLASQPFREHMTGFAFPWEFADSSTCAKRLRCAGFSDVETSLEEAPTRFPTADEFQKFVESVILRHHLEHLPNASIRQQLLDDLTAQSAQDDPPFLLDYWRLNMKARRPE